MAWSTCSRILTTAGLAAALAGCSWLGIDSSSKVQPRPGAATGDPNLASVPAKPQPILSAEQRRALTQDLVRDRENARYSDQPARIGDVAEAAPPRPAPPRPASRPAAAAPAAAPASAASAAAAPAPEAPPTAARKSDDDSPWWWPFGGSSGSPSREAEVVPAPMAPPAAASAPATAPAARKDEEESSWWWPFGGSSRSSRSEAAAPAPAPADDRPTVAATPENMNAPPGVMPVTGKPLPQPEAADAPPATLQLAPVPATPPRPDPSAPRIGPGSAPQGATVPAMPPVGAPPPPPNLTPDVPGRAPPPPMASLPPPPPTPERATSSTAAAVSILVSEIEFGSGSAALPADGAGALEGAVALHRAHGGRVRVVAQSLRAAAGTPGDAMLAASALAGERAAAIARELVRQGVAETAVVQGAAPGPAGREPRRVAVFVEY